MSEPTDTYLTFLIDTLRWRLGKLGVPKRNDTNQETTRELELVAAHGAK